ncbi:PACE efflux transporter [Halopseudomonas laoshanensis]|uniref:PACE efflux transporter n=1 Tax=Halopseudomonas laoshanensis TaxID=2268758 RepID=UPI0037353D8C
MQGIKRKLVYVTLYEVIATAIITLILLMMGHAILDAGVASGMTSAIAVSWNLAWNSLFESWEARQPERGRNIKRRIMHALGFEFGLLAILVPVMAWWLEISLWHAFVLDMGLLIFFVFYTFVFSLAFDKIFGLPLSAQPVMVESQA